MEALNMSLDDYMHKEKTSKSSSKSYNTNRQ